MSIQRAAQLVEAGLWLQMSGDIEGARRLFEQALKLDPANARARHLLQTPPRPGAVPRGPATPPVAPPAAERLNLFDMDWSTATGLAPQPPAREGTGTLIAYKTKDIDEEPRAASGPPPPPPDEPAPVAADFAHPDEIPVQLPSPSPEDDGPKILPFAFAPDATSAWDSQSNPGVHIRDVTPGMGDAMDLVASADSPPEPDVRSEVETLLRGAKDLLDLDDHSGAIELIQKAQQLAPNDPQVIAMRERSEQTLQAMFESKLGPMTARPRVLLKDDEIIWLNLDHRAGFVLAQIDGTVSFEDLFEVCGMSRLDTARILAQLVDEGVISAKP